MADEDLSWWPELFVNSDPTIPLWFFALSISASKTILNVSEGCALVPNVPSLGVGRWGLELVTYPG